MRLVDCHTVTKDSSHHIIGNVFTSTRILRNETKIDFNENPLLLLGFTASFREKASIFKLSPFNISTKGHTVKIAKYSVRFHTPLSCKEEVKLLDHLSKIIRGEETYLNETQVAVEQDMDLPLDITEVDKSLSMQLNYELSLSIYQSIMLSTKLDLTLHFPIPFVAKSEITFNSKLLHSVYGIPTTTEILEIISPSLTKTKTPTPEVLWNILRKFRIRLYGSDPKATNPLIVDVMHGAVLYKKNTYWRFNSKWYSVSSDRMAVVQHQFRQLLQNNLIDRTHQGYLSHKFPTSMPTEESSGSSTDPQPSTSTAANIQDSQESSQQLGRHNLEHVYNCSYAIEQQFLVGDKVTANNIEIFDLLQFDQKDRKVWIYHVKRKFGQCTRDAASQLAVSAKIVYDDLVGSSGEKTLHKHYNQLIEKVELNEKLIEWGITGKEDYVNLYRNNELTFVYAFVDEDNKRTKKTLKGELQIKATVELADLEDKLRLFKLQINDHNKFNSIVQKLYELVFDIEVSDYENLNSVAKDLFNFLAKEELIEPNGNVTSKLLYGINFNQFGNINKSVGKFQVIVARVYVKVNFFEFILKPYRSLYQTLIAKIELQRLHRFISEKGFHFQICEIELESSDNRSPGTTVTRKAIKRDSSRSNSSKKKTGSSSKKKKILKPLITEAIKTVKAASRNLTEKFKMEEAEDE